MPQNKNQKKRPNNQQKRNDYRKPNAPKKPKQEENKVFIYKNDMTVADVAQGLNISNAVMIKS